MFCRILFQYQYVKEETVLTEKMTDWFFEHSNGTLALVVTIFHDAQEIAICVTYSGAVFTDIDLPEELHKEEDARVFEMVADAYEELFDRFPPSLVLRSGGGLTHLL